VKLPAKAAAAVALLAVTFCPPASAETVVPQGFAPASISWPTPEHGVVLGYAPCSNSAWCPHLLETTDSGHSWHRLTAPPIGLPENHNHVKITFSTALDGFASDGNEIQATGDGGRHWRRITLSGLQSPFYVYKVTSAAGRIFAVAASAGRGDRNEVRLYSGSESLLWPVSGLAADGGVAYGDITANGGVQVVLGVDNQPERYWTSADGIGFDAAAPPCPAPTYASLAGVKSGPVVALCSGSPGSPQPGSNTKQLAVAPRKGAKFERTSEAPALGVTQSFAAASARRATIAAEGGGVGFLYSTVDGGGSWTSQVLSERGLGLFDLTFPSDSTGFVVDGLPDASEGSAVYRTQDGGSSWAELTFP
jgi:hypothetical protein